MSELNESKPDEDRSFVLMIEDISKELTIAKETIEWSQTVHPQIYYILKMLADHEDRLKLLEARLLSTK